MNATCFLVALCVALTLVRRVRGGSSVEGPIPGPELQTVTASNPPPPDPSFLPEGAPGVGGVPGSFGGGGGGPFSSDISHPYAVSLRRRHDLRYFCAGALTGKRHVLTAAHCVDASRTSTDSQPMVIVGSSSSTSPRGDGWQAISTRTVHLHPGYRSRRFPDLTILELSSDANGTIVQLPTRFLPKNGDNLSLIGWGRRSSSSANSNVVQVLDMSYVLKRTCRAKYGRPIRRHQICLGGDGVNSCEGDNGGPIVLPGRTREEDVLVGIVGWTHVCGRSDKPDVHTDILPYMSWIRSFVGFP